ncbi:MAG: FAD-binding oxidoreductase [Anaerococcus sp.]
MKKYNEVNSEIIEQIKSVVSGKVYVGEEINQDFFRDEMPIYGQGSPDILVDAINAEEISAVVKICNENNIPVLARGAGTGLVGAGVSINKGVMINMQSMNKILSYDEENMAVTVQPGVLLNDLAEDCLSKGYMYPPDPGEKFATLGGNVATNAGGMRAVKYGTTREYVRSMEVVLPNGEITNFGALVSKSSTGYSLKDLMVGSEGTLGIITELTLKMIPAPKEVVSLIVPYTSLDECISTVPKLFKANLNPQAIEFMEREIVIMSEKYIGKETFPKSIDGEEVGAYLLMTFDGDDSEIIENTIEQAAEILLEAGAIDVLVADTSQKISEAWAARSSFLEAIESQTKLLDECDVVVPINKIADYINYVNDFGKKFDFEVKSFGHAGDGNLHIYTCSNDLEMDEFKKQVDEFMIEIYKKAYEFGGKISGEHGIGYGKKSYLKKYENQANIELIKAIKNAFDPNNILNPNKVIDL